MLTQLIPRKKNQKKLESKLNLHRKNPYKFYKLKNYNNSVKKKFVKELFFKRKV